MATSTKLASLKFAFHDAVNLDPELTDTARRVSWLLLSKYLNGDSLLAWPAATTMSAVLGVHESTIWRSIQQLCESGYWTKYIRGGRNKSNRYRPCLERVAPTPGFDPKTLLPVQENPRAAASEALAPMRGEPLYRTRLNNPTPAASRSGSEARARDGLEPQTRNARLEKRDALPSEPLKASTLSQAQWSIVVADRKLELAKNWDLGLSAENRVCADELLKRSDFS